MAGKLALGTGLALAFGMLITGFMLANRRTKGTLKKGFSKALKGAKNIFGSEGERFQTIQHRIGVGKGKRGRKSRKGIYIGQKGQL